MRLRHLLLFMVGTFWSTSAMAQSAERFELQTLDYAPLDSSVFGVSGALHGRHLEPTTDLVLEYANAVLQLSETSSDQETALIDDRLSLDFGVAVGLWDRLQLDVRGSAVLFQNGAGLTPVDEEAGAIDPFAFGDIRVGATVSFLPADALVGLGLRSVLFVPTGSETGFASDGTARFEPRIVADVELADVTLVANAGYQFRSERTLVDYRSDDAFRWGAAARWATDIGLGLDAAVYGSHSVLADAAGANPVEAMGGVWLAAGGFTAMLGAGRALNSGVGAPALRVLVSLAYRPGSKEGWEPKRQPAVARRASADGGSDSGFGGGSGGGGSSAKSEDQCPYEDEDIDGFEDEDGCPDPDNDADGIADADDACPDQAGVTTKAGCPVIDEDADGVDDAVDACVGEAEDVDQFEDDDGCPDLDNDRDGIADVDDKCPLKAEVVNGNADEDGCPDEGEPLVSVKDDRIEISERVYFDNDRATIKQRSYAVLEQVATALKANPEIEVIAIEGHTDSRGNAGHNRALSDRRARAVREFLESRGVDGKRLRHRGYGASHPIAPNSTTEGRAINRRVEFLILRRSEESP